MKLHTIQTMIFPELEYKKFGYINLNLEAEKWISAQETLSNTNPLLDPMTCQKMVDSAHKNLGLDFSYGGWMEDRSILWQGSYLDNTQTYIHLGVDINVTAGTKIIASFDATVVIIDDDYPEDGGWGCRIIIKHSSQPIYMIYAHLDRDVYCKVGDTLKQGAVFAKVGKSPFNGNWFPHLHLQSISEEYFDYIEKHDLWNTLDGYGSIEKIQEHAVHFPDPMQYISLLNYNNR